MTTLTTVKQANLSAAYAECRAIARREAKNFYYAFVALPEPRRNAICAVYAFMRKADDLADDESIPLEQRRRMMATWRADWNAAAHGGDTEDPVFLAIRDAVQRFNIPLSLLNELIAGTTMDLESATGSAPHTYATFEELYRYCYLVASVVGLVCIRIFGYSDSRTERLAEETGVAFQLTNILRDVQEDAERRRVYLPLDMLAQHGLSAEDILTRKPGAPPTEQERAVLTELGARADKYYESAKQLLPLIHRESRPAMWVLFRIYYRLLIRMRRGNYDVFTRRASVPTFLKLEILAVGMIRLTWARLKK